MQFDFLAVLVMFCFYIDWYPSFGCARKWSVSTYTSIWAGTSHTDDGFSSCSEAFYFAGPFVYFLFGFPCPGRYFSKNIAVQVIWNFTMFSVKILMVSWLTVKPFIHFELILVYGVSWWSSFIFLHEPVQFIKHHLLTRLSLLHCMLLSPLSNINWT